ncbi:MAG: TRAP transporter small permease subunit [Pseudomonadota bacterium]
MYEKLAERIAHFSLGVASVCIAVMILLTVADVFMRYVFSAPLAGTGEHTQLLLAVVVFSGLVLVTREGSHIMVSLFEPTLLRVMPKVYNGLRSLAYLLGMLFIVFVLIEVSLEMIEFEEESEVMEYPLVYLGVVMTIFAAFGLFQVWHVTKHGASGHSGEVD